MSSKFVFGSVVVCILLGIYVYLVWEATSVVACSPQPTCKESFTDGMASYLSTIAGLVSALVIAELAITQPGKAPAARALASTASVTATRVLRVVTFIYIGVWVLVGVGAFLVSLKHPDGVPALTDLGKSWFGLAIAAAYAYWGISQKNG